MSGKDFEILVIEELKALSENQKNTRDCINRLDTRLSLHSQKMEYEIKKINKLDEDQNKSLDKHIEGVNTLKAMHSDLKDEIDARLDRLEQPRKLLKLLQKVIIYASGIASLAYGVLKLLDIL